MAFGLRTLASAVRGGACAVGGAVKAVAGVAAGCGGVLNVAKGAVLREQKPRSQAEGREVEDGTWEVVASKAPEHAVRGELLLGALLLVPVVQAPHFLIPAALGTAALKVLVAHHKGKRERGIAGVEKESKGGVAKEEQGPGCGSAAGGEGSPEVQGSEAGLAQPPRCREHQPHGMCFGCFQFTGTAGELLHWFQGESRCSSLPEQWVLAILQQAAKQVQELHAQGRCAASLGPESIQLTRLPLRGRPITAEHVSLGTQHPELPATALPLPMQALAENLRSLGHTAAQLLGGNSAPHDTRWAALTPAPMSSSKCSWEGPAPPLQRSCALPWQSTRVSSWAGQDDRRVAPSLQV